MGSPLSLVSHNPPKPAQNALLGKAPPPSEVPFLSKTSVTMLIICTYRSTASPLTSPSVSGGVTSPGLSVLSAPSNWVRSVVGADGLKGWSNGSGPSWPPGPCARESGRKSKFLTSLKRITGGFARAKSAASCSEGNGTLSDLRMSKSFGPSFSWACAAGTDSPRPSRSKAIQVRIKRFMTQPPSSVIWQLMPVSFE